MLVLPRYSNKTAGKLLPQQRTRFFCSAVRPVKVSLGSVKQIVLPLKSGEERAFSLRPNQSVRQLISSIREEDPSISSVVVTDSNGNRVSHLAKIGELNHNFQIRVDSETFEVNVQNEILEEMNVLTNSEVNDLCTKAYYRKIRQRLSEDKRHHMPYNEYLQWCSEYGLTEEQGQELSKALHLSGEIIHFKNNRELKDFLFLHPEELTNAVTHALELKYMKIGAAEHRATLDKILEEYIPLDEEKRLYDKKAQTYANRSMYGIFGYLVGQFSVLAHMVWVDFNWDIMEPVTYFVFLTTMIVGYTFFVKFSQEFTYDALKDRQRKKALRRLYLSNDFNWRRWKALDSEVGDLVHKLGAANAPLRLLNHNKQNE
eukprot:TRINITY_DN12881_c0_g1_i1.p1 TRINITY_DN12881_c0_g1~~TRINITY_DN12881_c0_g1_i1.p1  ORF type:complete len:372 (-),score=62.50 TRINITY_DN12881_c0_g1_i1:25-1140(-)